MTKQLLIMRHASAEWPGDFSHDMMRSLTQQGELEAIGIGQWLAKQGVSPDYVLSSPAIRCNSTLGHILTQLPEEKRAVIELDSLYLASREELLRQLRDVPASVQRLLLVGHNPGLEQLLVYLADAAWQSAGECLSMGTANLAWLELSGEFAQLSQHQASLRQLVRPADL